MTLMCIDPLWSAVNESPLAICIVIGGILVMLENSDEFPEMWLEVAE